MLGNLANEVERLGFQHQLWGDGFRALWQRGGVGAGTRVLDAGCGPGFASLELAQLVDDGKVIALDLTDEYLQHLQKQITANAINNIEVVKGDLHNIPLSDDCCDVIFAKFVLLFVDDLDKVLAEFRRVLRPGGHLLISDYCRAGQFSPPETPLGTLVEFLSTHYTERGVNIEVGRLLPAAIAAQDLQLQSIVPEVKIGRGGDNVWQWAELFMQAAMLRLVTDGSIKQEKADYYRAELKRCVKDDTVFYYSPLLLHFAATKPVAREKT